MSTGWFRHQKSQVHRISKNICLSSCVYPTDGADCRPLNEGLFPEKECVFLELRLLLKKTKKKKISRRWHLIKTAKMNMFRLPNE